MQPLLSVRNVSVRFGGLIAIDDVSFDVQPGELLGLMDDRHIDRAWVSSAAAVAWPPRNSA